MNLKRILIFGEGHRPKVGVYDFQHLQVCQKILIVSPFSRTNKLRSFSVLNQCLTLLESIARELFALSVSLMAQCGINMTRDSLISTFFRVPVKP